MSEEEPTPQILYTLTFVFLIALSENYANKEYQMKLIQEGKQIALKLVKADAVVKIIQQITLNCQWVEKLEKPIRKYFFDKK